MPDDGSRYQVGNVAEGATVLQGEYLYNITVQVQDLKDAEALLRQLKQRGEPAYYGPLLRRLDPIVFVNRSEWLGELADFFANPAVSVLYVLGLAAIGKSTLVRGAIELRSTDTAAVWVTCEGLDAGQLLAEINAGLQLDTQGILADAQTRLAKKIAAVLGAIQKPSILVLDGLEALLDAEDRFSSAGLAEVMEALVTLEHKAKVLVTSRRLPHDVGEGTAGIQIMRLGGLAEPMAEALFLTRARFTPEQTQTLLQKGVLQRLDGHPKFIELLASALAELPTEQVIAGLLQASDIGAFVLGQVFSQMSAAELQVLHAAFVFRTVFTYEALNAVHSALNDGAGNIIAPVKTLVRHAVLESVTSGAQIAYYLHPILRDAVPREAGQEAAAHAAAARWFQQTTLNPGDLTTWDDTLYHLRSAAEIEPNEAYFQAYKDYLFDHNQELSYAGWGRRLVSEYRVMAALAQNPGDRFTINWVMGLELWLLNELDQALTIFRELDNTLSELQNAPDADSNLIAQQRLLVKAKIGDILVNQGKFDEACRLADEMEPIADASGNIQKKLRHRELRFAIARKLKEPEEMLNWATKTLELAEQWSQESPSPQTQDAVAEAHFNMAIAYLNLSELKEMFEHFFAQLRIKLEIGKMSGVAAGLFNVGSLLRQDDSIRAGALLLTSDQIDYEVGTGREGWAGEQIEAVIPLFSDPNNIEVGSTAVANISEKLLPYYRRALARHGITP